MNKALQVKEKQLNSSNRKKKNQLTLAQMIEKEKEKVKNANYDKLEIKNRNEQLKGTLYVKERMDYGFHIYFIHEPDHRNELAGKNGTLTEMFYDLRHKVYWIKRNLKQVNFSVRNIDAIFIGTNLKEMLNFLSTKNNEGMYFSGFKQFGAMDDERREMFGRFFHRLITEHSYFELLYKAGLHTVGQVKNKNGKNPLEILGISKTQWKIKQKFSRNINIDKFYSVKSDLKIDGKFLSLLLQIQKLEDEYGIDKVQEFIDNEFEAIYGNNEYYNQRSAINITKNYNLPELRVIRYIYFECDVMQGMNAGTALHQYEDYVRMSKELQDTNFERYPRFLKTKHDIVARNHNLKLDEITQRLWDEKAIENKKYEYTYKEYRFTVPEVTQDLVKEGNAQAHCVASYQGKVAKGFSVIVFMRLKEKPELPLITIEIQGNKITQARRKFNYDPVEEELVVIRAFAKKFELEYNK